MLRPDAPGCCPVPPHPPLPDIRSGLSVVPRQLEGFPEYRRAMLAAIRNYPALAGWRADSDHDLGVMLLEAWAYVLDITAFYDQIIANRAYLGTSGDGGVMREILGLIGYVPRPALVARVQLALEASGEDKVVAPAGTGFRSEAFDDQPPQIFELAAPADVWPQRNRWTLAPCREDAFDGILRFLPGGGPSSGSVVAVESGNTRFVGRVSAVESAPEADGLKYQRVRFEEGDPTAMAGVPLSTTRAWILTTRVSPSPLLDAYAAVGNGWGVDWIVLDSLYPQVAPGQPVAVEREGALHVSKIVLVWRYDYPQPTGVEDQNAIIPLTMILIEPTGIISGGESVQVHLVPRQLGRPTRVARTSLTLDDVRECGTVERPVRPLGAAPAGGEAIAAGAARAGALLAGNLIPAADGTARFDAETGAAAFAEPLAIPVRIQGNVVEAVRGQTVGSETLGSGDAAASNQRFTLKQKPLSWTADSSMPLGRSPQLTVRVDGLEWTYVESFYDRPRDERIYRVLMAEDGAATILFGDGVNGARPTSGVGNITASYRWGAGAAMPPAGSIKQFSRPAKGLTKVVGPLPPYGGADAEAAADMRTAAPTSMLSLGRAVSVADFEAMVRGYSGIANAAVAYSWDEARHEAGILVWIIGTAGDVSAALAAYLGDRAVPGLLVRVANAAPVPVDPFDVTLKAAPGYAAETVREAVRVALFDPLAGLFSPGRIGISQPLFRSRVLAAIHAVPGVEAVTSIATPAGEMPKAMTLAEGQYFDLLTHGQVL
ncbi:MAG: hypothetical protein ABWX67_14090 [Allosphingosinicella sp.]